MSSILGSFDVAKSAILRDPRFGSLSRTFKKRIEKVLDYNVGGGKLGRGELCVAASSALQPDAGPQRRRQFQALGWTLELLQGMFLVADDVMDGAELRRGKTAWHRLDGVGLSAVNDAFVLDNAANSLLRSSLGTHPKYWQMLEALNQTRLVTVLGQMMDMEKRSLDACTSELYAYIVRHKTAHYTVFAPIHLALLAAETSVSAALLSELEELCADIGFLFQAQDDMLDWNGAGAAGKSGRDTAEGKLTWPLAAALRSPEARPVLEAHLGHSEAASVAAVQGLYRDLGLVEAFAAVEAESESALRRRIGAFPVPQLRPPLDSYLSRLLGRTC